MNRNDMAQMITDMADERLEIFSRKSHDYATDDALSNFKRLNILCKTLDIDVRRSPADCALYLKVLKLDRRLWEGFD